MTYNHPCIDNFTLQFTTRRTRPLFGCISFSFLYPPTQFSSESADQNLSLCTSSSTLFLLWRLIHPNAMFERSGLFCAFRNFAFRNFALDRFVEFRLPVSRVRMPYCLYAVFTHSFYEVNEVSESQCPREVLCACGRPRFLISYG